MFKKRKNGFTLVELLAVIVILAIILAIAIPSISGITNKAKADSLTSSLKLIIKGIDFAVLSGASVTTGSAIAPTPYGASVNDITTINISSTSPTTLSAVVITDGGKYDGCTVTIGSGAGTYTNIGTVTCGS